MVSFIMQMIHTIKSQYETMTNILDSVFFLTVKSAA